MSKFRFHFDAQGMKLDVPKPAVIADVAPVVRATPETPPDPATVVNELREWLDEHPDFGLDMSLLEAREILLTPPHWSSYPEPPHHSSARTSPSREPETPRPLPS